MSTQHCLLCNSENLTRIRTYKHYCFVCNDCNNLFHIKKRSKYLLEWILPRSICQKLFPTKVFVRLFHNEHTNTDVYAVYAKDCQNINDFRKSEVVQLVDTLKINDIQLDGKAVLDISGGPGYVGKELKSICSKVIVTEISEYATKAMSDILGIETMVFNYNTDRLEDLLDMKFDIVLLRSSIIFCEKLDEFIASLRTLLKPDGYVLLETILPTLGEVLWWQQMEFKFPFVYSQETIEKLFYKHGFSLKYGQRDYENYFSVMRRQRQRRGSLLSLYTFFVEYPLVWLYYLLARKKKISIETSLNHKMLTQIWQKTESASNIQEKPYRNYIVGGGNKSFHFGSVYNHYLTKESSQE